MAERKSFKHVAREATSKFISMDEKQNDDDKVTNDAESHNDVTIQHEPAEGRANNIINEALTKDTITDSNNQQLPGGGLTVDDGKTKERLNLTFFKEEIDYMNVMMRLDNIKFVTHYISKLIQEDKTRRSAEYGVAVKLFKL